MLKRLLVIAGLLSVTFAPLSVGAQISTQSDGKASMPRVVVLSTGGTIAGQSRISTDTTNYASGKISGNELVSAVPEIAGVADVVVEQVANVSSPNLKYSHLLILSKAATKYLNDESVSGVVITHGTSTAEETATFLELTVQSNKPVVVVGAMRPASAISADGPFNLLQAISVAADQSAAGRGVMLVANDRISSAMYTSKTHTQALDTFQAADQGHLGVVIGTKPHFFYTPAQPVGKPYFDVTGVDALPKVDIIYGYAEDDPSFINHARQSGARGIVVAGPGNSSLSSDVAKAVAASMEAGVPVVRATRVGAGYVTAKKEGIGAGFYNPQKARLLLALAINSGASVEQIQKYFMPY